MRTSALLIGLIFLGALRSLGADRATNAMVTKEYPILQGALHSLLENPRAPAETPPLGLGGADSPTLDRKLFEDAGVFFPEGSSLSFNKRTSIITLRNTPENHRVFKRVLYSLGLISKQVEIEAKLVRVCDRKIAQRLTPITLTNLPPGKMEVLDLLSAVSISGESTHTSHWHLLGEISDDKKKAPSEAVEQPHPEATIRQQTNDVPQTVAESSDRFGSDLNATATLGIDNRTINVTLVWVYRRLNGWTTVPGRQSDLKVAVIIEKSLATSFVTGDGESVILTATDSTKSAGPASQKTDQSCSEFLVVATRLIDPRGLPIQEPATKH